VRDGGGTEGGRVPMGSAFLKGSGLGGLGEWVDSRG